MEVSDEEDDVVMLDSPPRGRQADRCVIRYAFSVWMCTHVLSRPSSAKSTPKTLPLPRRQTIKAAAERAAAQKAGSKSPTKAAVGKGKVTRKVNPPE